VGLDPEGALGDERARRVLYTESAAPPVRPKVPAELEADERFAPAPFAFAADLSALPWQSAQLDRLGLPDQQRSAYLDALEHDEEPPIHRMLGHPDAVQNDPRTNHDNLCLLLQINSDDIGMTDHPLWVIGEEVADDAFRTRE